jgi:small subunit ribosomal protein S11
MSRKKRLLEKQKKKQTSKKTVVNKQKGGTKKKKVKKMIKRGQAHVLATYNNTVITITDLNGNTIGQASAGVLGFKGPKKATPYAASIIVKHIVEKVKAYGLQDVDVFLKGVGSGRESAVRALHANGINVMSIKDVTPIPHNGCRPKKVRRV